MEMRILADKKAKERLEELRKAEGLAKAIDPDAFDPRRGKYIPDLTDNQVSYYGNMMGLY